MVVEGAQCVGEKRAAPDGRGPEAVGVGDGEELLVGRIVGARDVTARGARNDLADAGGEAGIGSLAEEYGRPEAVNVEEPVRLVNRWRSLLSRGV